MGWWNGRKPAPAPPGPRRPPPFPECDHCRSQSPLFWTGPNLDKHLCGFCADKEIARMEADRVRREVLAFDEAERARQRKRAQK